MSESYKIRGSRYLRKYTAENKTPAYAYLADAETIANKLCTVPWERAETESQAIFAGHDEKTLDFNVDNRELYDAAEWCAEHTEDANHRAYAQAACYVFQLPDEAVGVGVESLKIRVHSDPYNPYGARISAMTSDELNIPMDCAIVRTGEVYRAPDANGLGAAPRRYSISETGGQIWYANSEDVVLMPSAMTLKKYLFVFVALENYNRGRDGWIEGSSYILNEIELVAQAEVSGLDSATLNDLSVSGGEYIVVEGGIYPSNFSKVSGVQTIQLQGNGDRLVADVEGPEVSSELCLAAGGKVFERFGIPSDQITCIQQARFKVHLTKGDTFTIVQRDFIVIGGTFDGGTFEELPGLYLYEVKSGTLLTGARLEDTGEDFSQYYDLIRKHGGLAMALFVNADVKDADTDTSSTSCVYLGLLTKDGTTFGNKSTGAVVPLFPFLVRQHLYSQKVSVVCVGGDKTSAMQNLLSSASVFNIMDGLNVSGTTEVYAVQSVWRLPLKNSDIFRNVCWEVLLWDRQREKIYSRAFGLRGNVQSTISHVYSSDDWDFVSLTGKNLAITTAPKVFDNVPGGGFIISGQNLKLGNLEGPLVGIAFSTANLTLDTDDVTFTSYLAQIPYSEALRPDEYSDFRLWALWAPVEDRDYCAYAKKLSSNWLVTGKFKKLGDASFAGVAAFDPLAGAVTDRSFPANIAAPSFVLDMSDVLAGTFIAPASGSKKGVVARPDLTSAHSAVGLSQLYGALRAGRLTKCERLDVAPESERPGAQFVVRSDIVSVDGVGDVPTWQMTTAKLVVPFATPDWHVKRLRLTWPDVACTPGATVNVWVKEGFIEDYPDIADPAIYDASASEVGGWKLVGVIDAAGGNEAEFPMSISGRTATLMFTAYVSMDEVPMESNQVTGVGRIDINSVNGEIENVHTGWKPDITLIG